MSSKTSNDGESESEREYIERDYSILVYPGKARIDAMRNNLQGDGAEYESQEKYALREFIAPFATAHTERDPERTRERERSYDTVTIGDETFESLGHDTYERMMKAVANSDTVTGVSFGEYEETDVSMKWSPKRLFREVIDALVERLPEQVSLTDENDYIFVRDGRTWETGDQRIKFDVGYSAADTRSHPETGERVPSFKVDASIEADSEAAADLLDRNIGDALIAELEGLEADGCSFVVGTGDVQTEVCKRTSQR